MSTQARSGPHLGGHVSPDPAMSAASSGSKASLPSATRRIACMAGRHSAEGRGRQGTGPQADVLIKHRARTDQVGGGTLGSPSLLLRARNRPLDKRDPVIHYCLVLIPRSDYCRWDAVEMARLIRDGEVSAADLAETARALIDSLDALNAVADLADGPFAGRRGRTGRGSIRGQRAAGLAGRAVDNGIAADGRQPGTGFLSVCGPDQGLQAECHLLNGQFGVRPARQHRVGAAWAHAQPVAGGAIRRADPGAGARCARRRRDRPDGPRG